LTLVVVVVSMGLAASLPWSFTTPEPARPYDPKLQTETSLWELEYPSERYVSCWDDCECSKREICAYASWRKEDICQIDEEGKRKTECPEDEE